MRLARAGHRATLDADAERGAARRATLERASAALTGTFGDGHLDDVRAGWPR